MSNNLFPVVFPKFKENKTNIVFQYVFSFGISKDSFFFPYFLLSIYVFTICSGFPFTLLSLTFED